MLLQGSFTLARQSYCVSCYIAKHFFVPLWEFRKSTYCTISITWTNVESPPLSDAEAKEQMIAHLCRKAGRHVTEVNLSGLDYLKSLGYPLYQLIECSEFLWKSSQDIKFHENLLEKSFKFSKKSLPLLSLVYGNPVSLKISLERFLARYSGEASYADFWRSQLQLSEAQTIQLFLKNSRLGRNYCHITSRDDQLERARLFLSSGLSIQQLVSHPNLITNHTATFYRQRLDALANLGASPVKLSTAMLSGVEFTKFQRSLKKRLHSTEVLASLLGLDKTKLVSIVSQHCMYRGGTVSEAVLDNIPKVLVKELLRLIDFSQYRVNNIVVPLVRLKSLSLTEILILVPLLEKCANLSELKAAAPPQIANKIKLC